MLEFRADAIDVLFELQLDNGIAWRFVSDAAVDSFQNFSDERPALCLVVEIVGSMCFLNAKMNSSFQAFRLNKQWCNRSHVDTQDIFFKVFTPFYDQL